MASKKQLKQYARTLEGLLFLANKDKDITNWSILASDNVSLETKSELSRILLASEYKKDSFGAALSMARHTNGNKNLKL